MAEKRREKEGMGGGERNECGGGGWRWASTMPLMAARFTKGGKDCVGLTVERTANMSFINISGKKIDLGAPFLLLEKVCKSRKINKFFF